VHSIWGGFWGAKLPKMGDSLPRAPMNRRAKFDAATFILAVEIRNRTNTHKKTNKQTVNYVSTPCLSACVDNKQRPWYFIDNTPLHCFDIVGWEAGSHADSKACSGNL